MKKVGFFGGTFNPLHLGHVNNIIEASCICETLYLILFHSTKANEIDHKERFMWLKELTKDMPNIFVYEIEDDNESKAKYDWKKGRDDVLNIIKDPIDIVFCGSDYKGTNRFESLYPESEVYYFDRKIVNISSTKIRNNPYKYWKFIPDVVRHYYNKKVMVVGTESCGKSTLVRNLAKVYNTTYVEEVGRTICEEAGGIDNMQPKHYEEIVYRHKNLEIEKLKIANRVLFIDTDALITEYYYRLQFENTPIYNEKFTDVTSAIANLNQYNLWLFLEPDVKWVQDGTRTYGSDEVRIANNNRLKKQLKAMNIKYKVISGSYIERYQKSKKLIDRLLK